MENGKCGMWNVSLAPTACGYTAMHALCWDVHVGGFMAWAARMATQVWAAAVAVFVFLLYQCHTHAGINFEPSTLVWAGHQKGVMSKETACVHRAKGCAHALGCCEHSTQRQRHTPVRLQMQQFPLSCLSSPFPTVDRTGYSRPHARGRSTGKALFQVVRR